MKWRELREDMRRFEQNPWAPGVVLFVLGIGLGIIDGSQNAAYFLLCFLGLLASFGLAYYWYWTAWGRDEANDKEEV